MLKICFNYLLIATVINFISLIAGRAMFVLNAFTLFFNIYFSLFFDSCPVFCLSQTLWKNNIALGERLIVFFVVNNTATTNHSLLDRLLSLLRVIIIYYANNKITCILKCEKLHIAYYMYLQFISYKIFKQ